MSKVFSAYGALAAAARTGGSYGDDEAPTKTLRVIGKPTYTLDNTFEQQEFLELDASTTPAPRKKNKLDLSFQCAISYMEDIVDGLPDVAQILIGAGAMSITDAAVASGSGNFVELSPISSGFKDTTFYGFKKEDGAGNLSRLKHLGTRCNWTLNVQGGSPATLDVEAASLYAFWEAFANNATIPAPVGRLGGTNYIDGRCWGLTVGGNDVPFKSLSFSPNLETSIDEGDVEACATGVDEILQDTGVPGGTFNLVFTDTLIDSSGNNYLRQWQNGDTDEAVVLTYNDGVQLFSLTMTDVRVQGTQLVDGDTRDEWACEYVVQNGFVMRWEVL